MAKIKLDGVLEAAHYKVDGQLDWVRVYERRGSGFSDRLILGREAFIAELKAGKRYYIGERIPYMGGQFNVSQPVRLLQKQGGEVIAVGEAQPSSDDLTGVPLI
jgi:hypothetical protein